MALKVNKPIMYNFISYLNDKGYSYPSEEYVRKAIDKTAFWVSLPTEQELHIIHLFFVFLQDECGIDIDTNIDSRS